MPPVHEPVDKGATPDVRASRPEDRSQELRELRLGHLAGGHREFTICNAAAYTGYVSVDFNVVGRIREYYRGLFVLHQGRVCARVLRICAIQTVGAEQP